CCSPHRDLEHLNCLRATTITQPSPHSNFALSVVIVPAFIQKIDPFIDSRTNDANAFAGIALFAQVIPAESDQGNAFTGAAERSMWDSVVAIPLSGIT